jgi:hypothetical protein
MSHIVQQAYAVNTVCGATVSATFASPVTSGNAIFVSAGAVDLGAAIGSDGNGASYGSLTDSQGNTYGHNSGGGPWIFGDRVNGKTLWFGMYLATSIQSGANKLTFTFTPITSAPNCQVGITIYEVAGLGSEIFGDGDGGSDSAAHVFPVEGGAGGTGVGWSGQTNGALVFVNGVATTNDGSTLNAGSGYALDGVAAAHIGSSYSTLGAESQFFSSSTSSTGCLFGNSPSSSSGVSSIAMAAVFALASAHDGGGNQSTGSNQGNTGQPVPASVSPTSKPQGSTLNVTVNGSGFGTAPTLSFSGTGITVNSYSVQSDTQIVASITIGVSATISARDTVVTNTTAGNTTGTLAASFSVTASLAPVVPNNRDQGHIYDQVLYTGTLHGWSGRTGYITPDTSLGDTAFPKISSGEVPSARANIDDFTFVPVNGQRVQFYMLRDSAGDKLAISIASM